MTEDSLADGTAELLTGGMTSSGVIRKGVLDEHGAEIANDL